MSESNRRPLKRKRSEERRNRSSRREKRQDENQNDGQMNIPATIGQIEICGPYQPSRQVELELRGPKPSSRQVELELRGPKPSTTLSFTCPYATPIEYINGVLSVIPCLHVGGHFSPTTGKGLLIYHNYPSAVLAKRMLEVAVSPLGGKFIVKFGEME